MFVRIARIGIPAVVAGALATGVAVAYWPQTAPVTAEPPIPSSATPLTDTREDRPDRSTDRPSTPPDDKAAKEKAAKEKAAKDKAAKLKAAEKKAAEEQAAKDKAAKEKAEQEAAEKKAQEEKESDSDSEGAGSQQSGDGSEDSDKSGDSEEKSGDSGSEDAYRAPTDWEEVGDRYVTTALNLRIEPNTDGKIVKVLPEGSKVTATSTEEGDYTLVIYSDEPRWLATEYLSKTKPEPREDDGGSSDDNDGFSSAPCPSGSGMEDGLTDDAIRVHRAICARFPSITDYIGVVDGSGYHPSGRAVDAMVDGDLGWEVAYWLKDNAKALGVMEVIHAQKIWTVQRSSEGWRSMEDRGSVSANHYDHVHISVYGNEGTG
ncbi:SH3 domain-containing protein [Microlunatus sp. GCM10028923]|uniref:SH3 domain-containing protein n=1 Tax=Microlunatus sp. GCM10028923 TaxID=3273400 RepID=UPI00360D826F